MRMAASWCGSDGPTEYKVAARCSAPHGELPSDRSAAAIERLRHGIDILSLTSTAPYRGAPRIHGELLKLGIAMDTDRATERAARRASASAGP
jgi:hypothetical protein